MHWYWQDLGLVCIFSKICPWLSDFRFRSIFYNKWTDFNQFLYTFTDCYAFFFWKFAAELWPLIDVDWDFFMHTWSFNLHHEKRWGWAIVRFSDNSIFKLTFLKKKKKSSVKQFGFRSVAKQSNVCIVFICRRQKSPLEGKVLSWSTGNEGWNKFDDIIFKSSLVVHGITFVCKFSTIMLLLCYVTMLW